MKLHITIIILFLIVINGKSQDFARIANYVNSLNSEEEIEALTSQLVKPYQTDIDKTASIFYWIAKNIKYDFKGFENDFWKFYESDQKLIEDTYKFKKGVCSGYARLFSYMLRLCEIESKVVMGYSRTDLETFNLTETNHDWNVVKIENDWYLFDVTWAWNRTKNKLSDFYFRTSPEIFILNHFPIEQKWTLLHSTFTLEDYLNFPLYNPIFHKIGFTKEVSKKGYFEAKDDTVSIDLKPTKDYLVSVKLYDLEKNEWFSPLNADQTRKEGKIKFHLDRKGDFIMKIGALLLNGNSYKIYNKLIYYRIRNE
jgi:transglutaminase/protease-like cytokinesis protein 3